MKTRFFLFIFLFPIFVFSQINEADSLLNNNSENRIEKEIIECDENIIMSNNIKKLLNKFIDINKSKGGIKGYCVQIYLGNDRDKARKVKHIFMRKYPEISPISYERINPNWKVRVGRFRTKLEAKKLKNKII